MRFAFFLLFFITTLLAPCGSALSFSSRPIPAKACIVIDDQDSVLYAKNEFVKLPPASTVKLITAMIALDRLDPDMTVTVSRNAASVRSIKPRLQAGDELTVNDLLHMTLMKSINSAAVALAEAVAGSEEAFAEEMNRKAWEIGARSTRFVTASGLPKGRQYTTVVDLTIILKRALSYPLIRHILGKRTSAVITQSGRIMHLENTVDLLWSRDDVIGGKTGFTMNAQHCFVGAMDTGKGTIFTAVLGARSRSRLWESTSMLADIGINPELAQLIPREKKLVRKARRTKHRNHI